MGAEWFEVHKPLNGRTVEEVFAEAADEARWLWGHAGYTGTIAEKVECVRVPIVVTADEAERLVEAFARDDVGKCPDRLIDVYWDFRNVANGKWEPAVAIEVDDGSVWFVGWASS